MKEKNERVTVRFKSVRPETAIKLAMDDVLRMEGGGAFSTEYFNYLVSAIARRYLQQGVPKWNG